MAYSGKTAVVTGGTGGIGFACARHLLNEGLIVRAFSGFRVLILYL